MHFLLSQVLTVRLKLHLLIILNRWRGLSIRTAVVEIKRAKCVSPGPHLLDIPCLQTLVETWYPLRVKRVAPTLAGHTSASLVAGAAVQPHQTAGAPPCSLMPHFHAPHLSMNASEMLQTVFAMQLCSGKALNSCRKMHRTIASTICPPNGRVRQAGGQSHLVARECQMVK